jgi:hypothetical protein
MIQNRSDTEKYKENLLELFAVSPIIRILQCVKDENRIIVGEILNHYSRFLTFMASKENRVKLDGINHQQRYAEGSIFTEIKSNSDLLHYNMRELIFHLPPTLLRKVFDWFLF